ncbi:MAG TPA: nodulation protein NfeD [Acidiferrobacterales bacterium]
MARFRIVMYALMVAWPLVLLSQDEAPAGGIVQLNIDGPIGPATSDYFKRGLDKAAKRQARLVVLRMDTPGGLDTSMRDIIQAIIASPVPVATFVAPSGARAASAGTYILYASHIAAMAPGTNLGSATPVQIGGVPDPGKSDDPKKRDKDGKDADKPQDPGGDAMTKKIVNDAVAYIRSLAQMRGRNAEWAEQAVRGAASLPAEEAVKMNVVDLMAANVEELLVKLHGRKVETQAGSVTLDTKNKTVTVIEPDWRSRLLSVITDPNVAYILMLLGVYGIFFELWNPGYIVPGVVGAICLLLALFAFQVLPVSYAGVGLILLGIAFMVAEVFMPSFGALGIGGMIAFVVGSVILIDTDVPGFGISWPLIAAVAITSAAFFMAVVAMAVKARSRQVVSGPEELIGSVGEALSSFSAEGRVRVHSEDWNARTTAPVKRGQKVRVTARDGLVLTVEPETQAKES